jgi:hypothetical protein
MTDIDPLLDSNKARQAAGAGTAMTLWRWQRDPRVQFPRPDLVINNRNYWHASTIRAWRERMAARPNTKAEAPAVTRIADQHAV